jgi:hypothetical protein
MMHSFTQHLATLKLGGTRYPTEHKVYKLMKKIEKQLTDSRANGTEHIMRITKPMKTKFDKYWDDTKHIAAINLTFDPRCKLELIEFLLSDGRNSQQITDSINQIRTNLYEWFTEISQTQNPASVIDGAPTTGTSASNNKNTKTPAEEDEDAEFKVYLASKKTAPSSSPTAELDLYLEGPPIPIDCPSFDILSWWKHHASRFPTLSQFARQILMTPMTSIASESAFSTSGRVLSDFRSSLHANTLEALVCGQDWI